MAAGSASGLACVSITLKAGKGAAMSMARLLLSYELIFPPATALTIMAFWSM
jgi:hypothetical protein